jgi:hypothetical protein
MAERISPTEHPGRTFDSEKALARMHTPEVRKKIRAIVEQMKRNKRLPPGWRQKQLD